MTDAVLRDRMLATVPALDDADWLDVRRRARVIAAPRRRNRRMLAIAAALAILTALVVNPALGIGERLLQFVEGDPAPESVKREFTRGTEPPELRIGHRVIERPKPPPPDLGDAHLALALDSSLGPVYLWVAPMTGGGACTMLEIVERPDPPRGLPRGGVSCVSAPPAERPIVGGETGGRVGEEYLSLIQGQVHSSIVRLEVTLSDGRIVPMRLVEGFFLAELPVGTLAEKVPGCMARAEPPSILPQRPRPSRDPADVLCLVKAVEYRGFDANGALVKRYRVPSLHRWLKPVEAFREAISIRLFSGREARIDYARAQRGTMCWRVFWGAQTAGTCGIVPKRSLPSAMTSGLGKNQTVLLQGPVGTEIARVELVWDDETREGLSVENGFVLKQIDPYGKRFPSKIVGRDQTGRIIVERSAFGPG